MITTTDAIIFIAGLIAVFLLSPLAILAFIAVFSFIIEYREYKKARRLVSKMECPSCQSTDIKIQSVQTGARAHTYTYGNNQWGTTRVKFNYKKEGICQKCGTNFDYFTQEEIEKLKRSTKIGLITATIFLVIATVITILLYLA